ncbi:MAG: sigma-54 dependent transcriptional regulator [Bdellovibrionales bacterium]|nr:sigma-54 dependent transcriptional regulator [Bdellovibrionales bacterium]
MIVKQPLPRILICDDDHNVHLAIKSVLSSEFEFKSAYHGDEALLILRKSPIDIVLLDMEIRTASEGLETIPKILEIQNDCRVIFFSGRTDLELVKKAMKSGAYDYVPKDCSTQDLAHGFRKALEHKRLRSKEQQLSHEIRTTSQKPFLIGESSAIERIRKQIERAKMSAAPVIISGETGTGKEVVARALRKTNPDGSFEPFVAIDSSTIQSSVSESILFGYEKGSFTGAEKTTRGLFEEANGGCIYFDELGNMPLDLQNKLLRVLQEKEVLRIGSSRPIRLDFRVICATNRDLEAMIATGGFKDDLYQRLNVLQIVIPPLRERPEDIPLLLQHFIELHSNGLERIKFLPETIEQIKSHPFPGNVRELSNLVLHLYSMCDEPLIAPIDLPPKFQVAQKTNRQTSPKDAEIDLSMGFFGAVEGFEKAFLSKAYSVMEGNISKMAQDLGMDRSYLHRKLKVFGIHPKSQAEASNN